MEFGPDTRLELMKPQQGPSQSPEPPSTAYPVPAPAGEREHMFDKVVTPSDVGKLNRLVIPKQHAEKHFPLDSAANEKGLLLTFEDRNGKQWRFRYSYWNSSQSYVMTKGWSRFVKDYKLDAGDVVSFLRHTVDNSRLFIESRRRPNPPVSARNSPWGPPGAFMMRPPPGHHYFSFPPPLQPPPPPSIYNGHHHGGQSLYRQGYAVTQSAAAAAAAATAAMAPVGPVFYLRPPPLQPSEAVVFDSVPVVHHANGNNSVCNGSGGGSNSKVGGKRLRLFGVNMECSEEEHELEHEMIDSSSSSSGSSVSGSHQAHHQQHHNHHHRRHALQLRLYNGTPIPGISTTSSLGYLNKGKASFNLDIN